MTNKILFLKKLPAETRGTAVVLTETAFYWRCFTTEPEWEEALQKEHFSLIVVDHRAAPGDPLACIEQLQELKHDAPTFLLSAQELDLPRVIKAIRLGVKDLFHPPVDLKAIIERVQEVVQPDVAPRGLEQWSEFLMLLAEGTPPAKAAPGSGGGDVALKLSLACQQRDELAAERNQLRQTVTDAQQRLAELEKENGRLTAEGKSHAKADAEIAALQEKLEAEELMHAQTRQKGGTMPAMPIKSRVVEAPPGKIEKDRAVLAEEKRKFVEEMKAAQSASEQAVADLARREQELAEKQQAQAEASARFDAEMEEFEAAQLLADQAQTHVDEVVASLHQAAEKLKAREARVAQAEKELAVLAARTGSGSPVG